MKSPLSNLPGWSRAEQLAAQQYAEEYNAAVLRDMRERENWSDTFEAESLALQVGELAGELRARG